MTRLRLPLALLALATTAHAQRITYRFTGEVTQISDFLAAPWDETVLGDPIELVCEVDPLSNQITSPDLPGLVVYGDSVRQITFAIGDSEITTSEANPTILSLQNDDPFTPACADSLFINTTIPGGLGLIVFLQVQGTPCPDVFTDNSIPTQLDLSDFDTRYIYLAIDGANLRASIDSVTIYSSTGDNVLFETDYPHSDGTFPHSRKIAHELFSQAGMNAEECRMVLRTNAITCYGLERFGITE